MQYPEAVVPGIVQALHAVTCSLEAAATTGATDAAAAAAEPAAGQLAAAQWAALLSQATAELVAVLTLLPLHGDWKAQLSVAFSELLQQVLDTRRAQGQGQGALLAGFRAALMSGWKRLPLTGADAAQVSDAPGDISQPVSQREVGWLLHGTVHTCLLTLLAGRPPCLPLLPPSLLLPACSCSCASQSTT